MGRMMVVDSDILIDCARKDPKAISFIDLVVQENDAKVSAISHMELIVGCRNKRELSVLDRFIMRFALIHLTPAISVKATDLLRQYRCSHGLLIPDAIIAATALLENEPLATRNQRDFRFIENLSLVDY